MFETRLHIIQDDDAINKRKLWEGWLQWANRLSGLGSDNISRRQFRAGDFSQNAFMDMFVSGHIPSDPAGLVSGESGTIVAASSKFITLETFGEYWVNWSISLKTTGDPCRFVYGIPFVGNTFVASSQDFKAEMGWYNNVTLENEKTLPRDHLDLTDDALDDSDMRSQILDDWGTYGQSGDGTEARRTWVSQLGTTAAVGYPGIVPITGSEDQFDQYAEKGHRIHLSGSGSSVVGRMSGNIGILLFCQSGSDFKIITSRLTIHKRNR